jgi:uncharacterized membrane-anchored protein YitT (DUF2179 family)
LSDSQKTAFVLTNIPFFIFSYLLFARGKTTESVFMLALGLASMWYHSNQCMCQYDLPNDAKARRIYEKNPHDGRFTDSTTRTACTVDFIISIFIVLYVLTSYPMTTPHILVGGVSISFLLLSWYMRNNPVTYAIIHGLFHIISAFVLYAVFSFEKN